MSSGHRSLSSPGGSWNMFLLMLGPSVPVSRWMKILQTFIQAKHPWKSWGSFFTFFAAQEGGNLMGIVVCTVLWWIRYFYCFSKIPFLCKDSSVRFSIILNVLLSSWGGKDLFSQGKQAASELPIGNTEIWFFFFHLVSRLRTLRSKRHRIRMGETEPFWDSTPLLSATLKGKKKSNGNFQPILGWPLGGSGFWVTSTKVTAVVKDTSVTCWKSCREKVRNRSGLGTHSVPSNLTVITTFYEEIPKSNCLSKIIPFSHIGSM